MQNEESQILLHHGIHRLHPEVFVQASCSIVEAPAEQVQMHGTPLLCPAFGFRHQQVSDALASAGFVCDDVLDMGVFQLHKASLSVFANITEAQYPQSLADMLSKFKIARKECAETECWKCMKKCTMTFKMRKPKK